MLGTKIDERKLTKAWDVYVKEGKVKYDFNLLQTRVLQPDDARLPFHLVFNEGRRVYLKRLAQPRSTAYCPFCSDYFESLRIEDMPSLRILPNEFPCLPHQFVLTTKKHTARLEPHYIKDVIDYAKSTGQKVYCNTTGAGGAYNHLVFQASGKHYSAPFRDFFNDVKTTPLYKENGIRLDKVEHTVFGIKLTGTDIPQPVSKIATTYNKPLNLLFKGDSAYIFPRIEIEIPQGFGKWKFGVLEATGTFICQDEDTFKTINYEQLERGMKEISQENKNEQEQFIKLVKDIIKEERT